MKMFVIIKLMVYISEIARGRFFVENKYFFFMYKNSTLGIKLIRN
jgi:hypothetical protein